MRDKMGVANAYVGREGSNDPESPRGILNEGCEGNWKK
jgi:hypothetical protein